MIKRSLVLALSVLSLLTLTSCLTISSSMPGSRDTTGDFWFVQSTVSPGPPMMSMVLESKIYYCPAVDSKDGPRIDSCYEATVPERFRK